MPRQYIAGELSLQLEQLQAAAGDRERAREVALLRYEAETQPLTQLGSVVIRAVRMVDRLCWDSLVRGDTVAFDRQAALGAALWEFGICARLVEEDAGGGE